MRRAPSHLERALSQVARFQNSLGIDDAHNHVDGVFFEPLQFSELRNRHERAIDIKRIEPLSFGPACHVGVKSLSGFHERREHFQWSAFRRDFDLFHDCSQALFFDR